MIRDITEQNLHRGILARTALVTAGILTKRAVKSSVAVKSVRI